VTPRERQGNEPSSAAADARERRLHGLLVEAQGGDGAAYTQFLTELAASLRAFLRRRMVRLPDEVEDVVQEVLLAVHAKRHTYRPDQPLTAWVYGIARYKLVDFLRARRLDVKLDSIDDIDEVLLAAEQVPHGTKRDLDKLLNQLPEKQRRPIVHMKLDGLSVMETAKLTGLSESAVKVSVHRGLKALTSLIRNRK
jgi:RNA polymerase sigma-70 factor (ECF subfamily)